LELDAECCLVTLELDEINFIVNLITLTIHIHFRIAWNATLRWTVSLKIYRHNHMKVFCTLETLYYNKIPTFNTKVSERGVEGEWVLDITQYLCYLYCTFYLIILLYINNIDFTLHILERHVRTSILSSKPC